MYFQLYVTAYDLMDQVRVSTVLYSIPDNPEDAKRLLLRRVSTVQAEGQTDPHKWTRDALVSALEAL